MKLHRRLAATIKRRVAATIKRRLAATIKPRLAATSKCRLAGMSRILASAGLLSIPAVPALAQAMAGDNVDRGAATVATPHDPADDRETITVGVGGGVVPSYEGSNDYVAAPVAAARGTIKGIGFATRGTALYIDVVPTAPGPSSHLEFGPVAHLNLDRTGRVVDPQVRALGKRKLALELGGFVGFAKTGVITSAYDRLSVSVAAVHDVTGISDSYVVTPSIDYGTPLSRKAFVGLSASADYAGTGYARTYFGVDQAGSLRSGLPVYNAHRGFKDFEFSLLGDYALTGDLRHGLGLFAVASYERLQNDFAASPLTRIAGSPNQYYGAVGLGYTF